VLSVLSVSLKPPSDTPLIPRLQPAHGRHQTRPPWLQLAAFALVLHCLPSCGSARRAACGTTVNRHERDQDGLAVRGLMTGFESPLIDRLTNLPGRCDQRRASAARAASIRRQVSSEVQPARMAASPPAVASIAAFAGRCSWTLASR
jgi:hypothetical protein